MSGIVLNVELRERTGKGSARQARREGDVPGVLYGGERGPVAIRLNRNEVNKAINSGQFISQLFEIDHKGEKQQVIAQDIQLHPVSDQPVHLDLFRVEENQIIRIPVPVQFINEDAAPGLKQGGTLNIVRHDIEVFAPAGAIPEVFEIDLSGLEIGDTVKVSAITMPEDITPTITDRDFTIATIAGRGGSPASSDTAEDDTQDGAEDAENEA